MRPGTQKTETNIETQNPENSELTDAEMNKITGGTIKKLTDKSSLEFFQNAVASTTPATK